MPRGKPFTKGEDSRRNCGGRPKNTPNLTNLIIEELKRKPSTGKRRPSSNAQALAIKLVAQALEGLASQQTTILNRVDGTVEQKMAHRFPDKSDEDLREMAARIAAGIPLDEEE